MSAVQNTFNPLASPPLVVGKKPAGNLVRFSLLAMTVLAFLFSVTFATVGLIIDSRLDKQVTDIQRIAVFLHILVSVVFALTCMLGLYACIAKGKSAASLFTSLVIGQFLLSLGSGIFSICLLFKVRVSSTSSVSDGFIRALGNKLPAVRGAVTALFVVIWLVEIATIVLGNAFVTQLREEAELRGEYDPKFEIEELC